MNEGRQREREINEMRGGEEHSTGFMEMKEEMQQQGKSASTFCSGLKKRKGKEEEEKK